MEAVQGAEEAGAVAFESKFAVRGRLRLTCGIETEILEFVARRRLC